VSTTSNAIGHQWRDSFYGQDSWRVSQVNFHLRAALEITPEAVNGKGNGSLRLEQWYSSHRWLQSMGIERQY
jgi:hypothetical protein